MHLEWLAMEHYRLHVVEQWPEGPYKHAALAAIHSTLNSLTRRQPGAGDPPCEVCSSRARQIGQSDLAA